MTPIENAINEADMTSRKSTRNLINQRVIVIILLFAFLIIAGLVAGTYFLLNADTATAEKIRDIFIIFMAFESILIGSALVILAIQLAVLINLLQNEIKPILDSTNETINTIRGTAGFLSNNLVEPVIKINEYAAALRKIVGFFRLPW